MITIISYQFVRALIKELFDEVVIMQLQGEPHGLRVLAKLAVQLERRLQQVGVLRVRHVGDAAGQVQAHPLVGILGGTGTF